MNGYYPQAQPVPQPNVGGLNQALQQLLANQQLARQQKSQTNSASQFGDIIKALIQRPGSRSPQQDLGLIPDMALGNRRFPDSNLIQPPGG